MPLLLQGKIIKLDPALLAQEVGRLREQVVVVVEWHAGAFRRPMHDADGQVGKCIGIVLQPRVDSFCGEQWLTIGALVVQVDVVEARTLRISSKLAVVCHLLVLWLLRL